MKRGLLAALGTARVLLLFPAAGSVQDSEPSWVDATGNVAKAARADRQGLAVLTGTYFLAALNHRALVDVTHLPLRRKSC